MGQETSTGYNIFGLITLTFLPGRDGMHSSNLSPCAEILSTTN